MEVVGQALSHDRPVTSCPCLFCGTVVFPQPAFFLYTTSILGFLHSLCGMSASVYPLIPSHLCEASVEVNRTERWRKWGVEMECEVYSICRHKSVTRRNPTASADSNWNNRPQDHRAQSINSCVVAVPGYAYFTTGSRVVATSTGQIGVMSRIVYPPPPAIHCNSIYLGNCIPKDKFCLNFSVYVCAFFWYVLYTCLL